MRKFVEQREDLPRLCRAVVDVDDREFVIIDAEAGILVCLERILKDENSDFRNRAPPVFERHFNVWPFLLVCKRNAKILANPRRHRLNVDGDWKREVACDQTWLRITAIV